MMNLKILNYRDGAEDQHLQIGGKGPQESCAPSLTALAPQILELSFHAHPTSFINRGCDSRGGEAGKGARINPSNFHWDYPIILSGHHPLKRGGPSGLGRRLVGEGSTQKAT